jgi:RNA polymerase sigma-70 factor (ECF subfamily)
LVRELKAGNTDAFQWVLGTYRPSLLSYAGKFLDDPQDMEDVVQDAFVRLWTHRDSLRAGGSVKCLLFATVKTRCVDSLRRRTRRRALAGRIPTPSPLPTPLEDLQASELKGKADEAIRQLSERRRTVFRLIRFQGLSYREVAETMSVSTQTVANTMSSALADLRMALSSGAVEGERASV